MTQFYLNFFLSLGDSHLLNFVQQGQVPVNRADADGNFLLHSIVAQQRAVPTVRKILEAGADPAQIDASGTTSVHLALRLERKDIAWALLTWWKTKRGFADGTGAA
jgi:ankyrin repeat protein